MSLPATLVVPTLSLWRREVVRFLRQRSRIIGALGTPVMFWLLIGGGLRHSFKLPGGDPSLNYMEYAFPGMLMLVIMFTAIFSTISVIEDRKEGFLQGVLVSPASRSAIAMGKILGSTTLALLQACVFLLLAPLAGVSLSIWSVLASIGVLTVASISLSALGFLLAWHMESTQGFHAVMNLFLMPMWLLSGSFFPASGASSWLSWTMAVNPLSYAVAALRRTMYLQTPLEDKMLPELWLSLAISLAFAATMVILAGWRVDKQAVPGT